MQERQEADEFTQVRQGELQDKQTSPKANAPEIQFVKHSLIFDDVFL